MLERFRMAKQAEIAKLRKLATVDEMPSPWDKKRLSFSEALRKTGSLPSVIAEYKRASPSRGTICEDVDVARAAREYSSAGAAAMSILTENEWFRGNLDFLAMAHDALAPAGYIPLLRKDFIFDPLQIMATAATPASALLLIVRLTPNVHELRNLREGAEKYGMECVVEIFDTHDLELARESGASIIQVNARDLDTLRVNRQATLALIDEYPPKENEKWIAASGMDKWEHLVQAANSGFDAVLVGTALMKDGEPGKALASVLDDRSC